MHAVQHACYGHDLRFITQTRTPGSPHRQTVQNHCFDVLHNAGFHTELHYDPTGVNVIGTKRGTKHPNEIVVFSAHCDHICDCAGADDNVSGVPEASHILGYIASEATARKVPTLWRHSTSLLRFK